MFDAARNDILPEITDQLADFRQKKDLGMLA
jgi:hypothetical protein